MTQTELKKREAALQDAGYHKSQISSTKDYSWFKTIDDPSDPKEWLYMIEWMVWDWRKYADRVPSSVKPPFSIGLCILVNLPDYASSRMIYPDILTIEQAEELAKVFYELIMNERWKDGTMQL